MATLAPRSEDGCTIQPGMVWGV